MTFYIQRRLYTFVRSNTLVVLGCRFRKRSHSASSSSGSDVSDDVHIVSHKKRSYRDRDRKMDEVERLAEMERQR